LKKTKWLKNQKLLKIRKNLNTRSGIETAVSSAADRAVLFAFLVFVASVSAS
jgi:hypothetical protein